MTAPSRPDLPPREPGLLVADTASLCAFARAGGAAALLAWAGDRLHVVRDVYQELSRCRDESSDVQAYLRYLDGERRLLELSQPGKVWVARVGMILGPEGIAPLATARMVHELRVRGGPATALVHGALATRLCLRLEVARLEAGELLRRMTRSGALATDQSRRIRLALGLPQGEHEVQPRDSGLASSAATAGNPALQ